MVEFARLHFCGRCLTFLWPSPNVLSVAADGAHTLTCALMLLNTDLHGHVSYWRSLSFSVSRRSGRACHLPVAISPFEPWHVSGCSHTRTHPPPDVLNDALFGFFFNIHTHTFVFTPVQMLQHWPSVTSPWRPARKDLVRHVYTTPPLQKQKKQSLM